MKVRAGSVYVYHPALIDAIDGRTSLVSGDVVRVVNLPGCPKANTMGHCHVADMTTGQFIGLVCTGSLHTMSDYMDWLNSEDGKRYFEKMGRG